MKPIINPNIYNSFLSKVAQQNFLSQNKPLPKPCELVFMPEGFIKQEKVGSYDDFIAKFDKHYPKMSLKCFAYMMKFFSKLIGRGADASVYAIPQIDDYCIRISKFSKLGLFDKPKPLHKAPSDFYGLNFGQPVATNGEGISILIKTKGEQYGIKNWIDCYLGHKTPAKSELEKYINNDMAKISEFPQSAFDDFMKRVSLIKNVTRRHFDFLNQNNFLIDYKNKRINVVDLGQKSTLDFKILPLELPLCDSRTLKNASPEQKENFEKYAEIIRKKCRVARENYLESFPKRKNWE